VARILARFWREPLATLSVEIESGEETMKNQTRNAIKWNLDGGTGTGRRTQPFS
jgi:hypothetical protein